MINVKGVLVTPLALPSANTKIRIESLTNDITLLGLTAETVTSGTGAYDFSLVNGDYFIDVNFNNEYHATGKVRVSADTVTPITLPVLLRDYILHDVIPIEA